MWWALDSCVDARQTVPQAAPALTPRSDPKGPGPTILIIVPMPRQPDGTPGKKPPAPSVKVRRDRPVACRVGNP
jgi:hypothetical protein